MESMGKWRKFFEGAEGDICSVIEYAILVAASDCPHELRKRREKIAERLYRSTSLDNAAEDHSDKGKYKDDEKLAKEVVSSWREVADERKKTSGNAVVAATAGVEEVASRKQALDNECYLKMDAREECRKQENTTSGALIMDGQKQSDRERQGNQITSVRHVVYSVGPGRLRIVRQQQMKPATTSLPLPSQHKLNLKEKMEATKRKLREGYQQAEKAKKQRTVQIIEVQDLPKEHSRYCHY